MVKFGMWPTVEVEGGPGCVFEPKDFRWVFGSTFDFDELMVVYVTSFGIGDCLLG